MSVLYNVSYKVLQKNADFKGVLLVFEKIFIVLQSKSYTLSSLQV